MNQNEINFCDYFEKNILPNRNRVNNNMVNTAASLLGRSYSTVCSSCLHNAAVDLLNRYNRLLPYYNEYKKQQLENVKQVMEISKELDQTIVPIPKKANTKKEKVIPNDDTSISTD